MSVVTGVFHDGEEAEKAVSNLRNLGIDSDNITIVSNTKANVKNGTYYDVYDRDLGITNQTAFGSQSMDLSDLGIITITKALGTLNFGSTTSDVAGFLGNLYVSDDVKEDIDRRIDNGEILLSVSVDKRNNNGVENVLKENGAINTAIF